MIRGFTCGSFDLFHAGHMLMLEEIRAQVDYLIVGLQEDPSVDRPTKNKPILTMDERCCLLLGCKYVDTVICYQTEEHLYDILSKNHDNINIRFVGADWKGKPFTGHNLSNMEVRFNSRNHNLSTSELRERVYQAELMKRTLETFNHFGEFHEEERS